MGSALDGTDRPGMPEGLQLVRGFLAEFLAMMFFVYFGCGSAASNLAKGPDGEWDPASTTIVALQFGLGITVLAYATAHSSGGHINCAVTWCLLVAGKCHPVTAVVYLIAQMGGSITGAALLDATTNGADGSLPLLDRTGGVGANGFQNPSVTEGNAFLGEMMGTFLLCFVVLEAAVNSEAVTTEGETMIKGNKQNLAPIPIGLAVFLAHVVLIPITGCSINPTRSFGPSLIANSWDNHWIWWVAPLAGATLAAVVWAVLMHTQEMTEHITEKHGINHGQDEIKTKRDERRANKEADNARALKIIGEAAA